MNRELRELDGIYFRVKRNDKWQSICFTDMTEDEIDGMFTGRSYDADWWKSIAMHLRDCIREMGEQFDIKGEVVKNELVER